MVTADEARRAVASESAARNNRKIVPLPPSLQAMLDNNSLKPIRIYNVGDKAWPLRPAGNCYYHIPACPEGAQHSEPILVPFIPTYGVAVDMNKVETRFEDCRAVVDDILGIGPFKPQSDNLTRYGVFAAAGETPTAQELAAANAAWEAWDLELVRQADALALANDMASISSDMRSAVVRRHLVRTWAQPIKAGKVCPVCQEMVPESAIVHGGRNGCGYVFDRDAAIAAGVLAPKQPPKQEAGK